MKVILLAAAVLIVVACGQSPAGSVTSPSSSSVMSTPTPAQGLLFAVLEANGTTNATTYNTVSIAGLDGHARATTTFSPMPVPNLGCIGAILPASAHVAAGKVFFADANGVVRSLSSDGTVTTAATFPMTSSQQMLSFAVSPDGAMLLATIFTSPKNAYPCDGSASQGTYTFDAYAAASGGSSRLVYHQSWSKPANVLALTGWDATGPIGTYPTVWASQGGGPGSALGVYVKVDATTMRPGAQLSDPSSCQVWNYVQSGAFVCMKDPVITGGGTPSQKVVQPVSIRSADGTELWHSTITGQNAPFGPFLAPDGQHMMICCNDLNLADSHEVLVGSSGSQVNLATGFTAAGWLDATTMVGGLNSNLAYVGVGTPGAAISMGFAGAFVGTVRA